MPDPRSVAEVGEKQIVFVPDLFLVTEPVQRGRESDIDEPSASGFVPEAGDGPRYESVELHPQEMDG
jgi:hypothetical protein